MEKGYTKRMAAQWLAGNGSVCPLVQFTPIATEWVYVSRDLLVQFSDGSVREYRTWVPVEAWDVHGRTHEDIATRVAAVNLEAWRRRHANRRNPSGCYTRDELDRLVGL